MIARKPSALAATVNCFHGPFPSQSSTSSTSRRPRTRQPTCRKSYATHAADDAKSDDSNKCAKSHIWPSPAKGQTCPTPYQIFAMERNAAYSKARFYELVKLYHPDLKNGDSSDNENETTSHAVKIERYRLLVAAHAILSDPAKRSAYDRFGAGWAGRADFQSPGARSSASPGPFSHSWGDPSDPIWRNATWEDWERWHARRDGTQTSTGAPLYMANSYFLALVIALAMVGGSMNYGRAQDAGHYFVEQRDLVHDRAAKDLRRVRQEVHGLSSKQDRVEFFVRQREATMGVNFGLEEMEQAREDRANRLLPDKEYCQSEEVKERKT